MTRRSARALPAVCVAAALLLLVVACSPAPTAAPTGPASVTASPAGTAAQPDATPPAQTDTAWGRIWDGIPSSFLLPSGAQPAGELAEPVSGAFDVAAEGGGPDDIARFYADGLRAAGFTLSADGPLEDGSFIVEAQRAPGCTVQVRSGPLGGLTRLTILYGAGCPFGDL